MREQGAVCVTDAAEVLELAGAAGEHLTDESRPVPPGLLDDLDPASRRVLDALPLRGSAPVANVARAAGLPPSEVRATLGHLELAGRARRTGSTWARERGPAGRG
jgi:DNA processing protein